MIKPKTGKEARALGLPRYFTGVKCKRGHLSERYSNGGHCVACDNERNRPDNQRKEITKRYYETNKEKCLVATKNWKRKSGKSYSYVKISRKRNPSLMQFANSKRHAAKMKRTPAWLNIGEWFEIECIYRYCSALRGIGLNYEVDHIIPLQGKNVSGLHTPWNLQVITAAENSAKGNRI
jgi:hypothetical protein